MDEEEELENTLIGQEEEAPAVNTEDVMMGGLGLGGAAFAAQTGRAPTPTPSGPLSPLAQQVAANDAARQAAARAASSASQPLGNLPRIGTLNPATGPSGGTTLPSQPSLQEARQAAARSAGVNPLSASRLARVGGPGALIYGAADLGLEALTGRGLSERIGEGVGGAVGNLLFPGAQSQPAFTEAETLQDLAAMSSSEIQTPSVAPSNALLEMLERADERERMGLPRQAALGIIDAPSPVVDPFTGQTIESPTPFNANNSLPAGMTMGQAAIMKALPNQNQGMDMNQQAISNAQIQGVTQGQETMQGQEATAPSLDQTLSQFMRNEDASEQRTEQFVDPQGRLRRRLTPEASALQGFAPGVQPLAPEYTDFERESLARQIRSGGTGSFAGDSAALQARIAERDRLPGETQTERDTRIARSRTTGGQTVGMSFDDARRRAEGQLAARGIINPPASQVNALARSIQAAEPERLAELETKRALDAARIKRAELETGFEPKELEIGGKKYIQYTPTYIQPVIEDTPEKTGLQATLENLQSDLTSGRLTQEEYDIAVRTATNAYIGREEPKPVAPEETSGLIDMDSEESELPDSLKNSNPSEFTGQTLEDKEGNRYTSDGTRWIKV